MSIISRSVRVSASVEDTWNVVRDFGGVHRWHAKVERSPLLSSNNEGLGAKRRCEFYDEGSVVEEIVSYDEQARFFEVVLSDFSMPLTQATATMRVEPIEDDGPGGGAEVTLSMDFEVKYGPIGWVMDRAMMRPMMGKMFGQVLDGLRTHLETGQLIGEGGTVNVQVAAA